MKKYLPGLPGNTGTISLLYSLITGILIAGAPCKAFCEGLRFIENKGQIIDQNNKPNPDVKYLINTPGFNVQLRKAGFSYDVYSVTSFNTPHSVLNSISGRRNQIDSAIKEYQFHRIDFDLIGANLKCEVVESNPSKEYYNYYTTGTPVAGVTYVRSYQSIIYKNIYPGIDLEFLTDKEHGFKYNFIISSDGDINKIRFKISGAIVEEVSDSAIILRTKFGILKERLPESFIITDGSKLPGRVKFVEYADSLIGFSAPSDGNIIIDPVPQRLWATYFGGTGFDGLGPLSLDGSGNIYSAGSTTSLTNIATSGSYQEIFMGAMDAFICKFSPSGNIIWATYYGGIGSDNFSDVFLTNDNKLILAGNTSSPSNISTPGAYQTNLTGPTFNDAMLVKFDTSGFRIWGTYFGGTNMDGGKSCVADQSGNIYLWGNTRSADGIATPGSFQQSFAGGTWDCYLAKFTSDGSSRLWGTYYGGPGLEELPASKSISILNDSIYVFGNTYSTSGISSPGSFQSDLSGIMDVFFAKFSPDGSRIWGTYFGGPDVESAGGIHCGSNKIFICGRTQSASNIASPGCFQPNLAGSADAFLASFNSKGIRQWSTYFGGTEGDDFQGIDENFNGDLYLTGFSASLSGITTPDAFQENYSGGVTDGIIIKFDALGNRIWGTYYGGEGHDYLTNSVCLQPFLYVSGNGNSANGISTPGSYQALLGGNDDGYLMKFNVCPIPENSGPISGNNSICVPGTGFIYSIPAIPSASGYHWSVPQGATIISGNNSNSITVDFSPSAVSGNISVYGTNSCGSGDSSFIPVTIIPAEIINVSISASNINVCVGTSVTYNATPTNPGTNPTYQWKVNGINSGTNSTSFIYTPLNTDVVTCELTSSLTACITNNPATSNSITMVVNPVLPVSVGISASANPVCAGTLVTFTATPTNGGSAPVYQWRENGMPVGTNNVVYSNVPLTGDIVSCTLTSDAICSTGSPATSTPITMTVDPQLTVGISIATGTTSVCAGTQVMFTAMPANPGTSPFYQWKVNGVNAGTNSTTFTYTPLNGDVVSCDLTSSLSICVTSNPATSNSIMMTVDPPFTVGVSISTPTNTVCAGTSVTFTAIPTNPGSTPVYQWKVNGINVGTNATTFTYTPVNGDVVTCFLTSSLITCVTGNPATSNPVAITVNPLQPVSVSIGASASSVCSGTLVTFTATPINGGSLPVFQWKRNGENTGTNSQTYIYAPTNGDIITCTLTSSLTTCVTGNPASSNPVSITVNPLLSVSVSIAASANPVCSGSSVTFNAAPINPGPAPVYQWKVNGVNSGTNSSMFTYIPANNDQVWCVLTSNEPCAINNPASCIPYPITVKPLPQVTYSSCYDTITTISAQPIKLKGGVPVGGTYSGPGVNSTTGYFNPSVAGVGVKTISYSYQNIYSCSDSKTRTITVQPSPLFTCGGTLTDLRDGKTYPTVLLGTQCWMQKNLDYGGAISAVNHQKDNCLAEKYCYNDDAANCATGGGLYQWDEVMQFMDVPAMQGLCPAGWHIPTQAEWLILFNYYQGQGMAGKPIQDSIISGFRAKESGVNYSNASWKFQGFGAIFWSSTPSGTYKAVSHGVNVINFSVSDYYANRSNAFGVRCVRD